MPELEVHDPFVLPDELELEHEIRRPKWYYAAQLRTAGATWTDIAKALGYKDASSAQATVKQNKQTLIESKDEIVQQELERLDALQLVCWRTAQQGDLKAIALIIQLMGARAKLLGLEKFSDASQDAKATFFIGGSEEEYVAGLEAVMSAHRPVIEHEER